MVVARDPVYPTENIENLVPCADGAGEVEAVGEDSLWKVGDKVVIHFSKWIKGEEALGFEEADGMGSGSVHGTLREYAVLPDEQLIKAPSHLTMEEIASIDLAGGTASNALFFGPKRVGPGMTVLTLGTGGVSCFAIQLASAVGATVIATSSSDIKLITAKALGATHVINYKTHPQWSEEVLRITDGKGVDHVIENGGAATLGQSLKCTKRGGVVSVIGFLAGEVKEGDGGLEDVFGQVLFGANIVRGVLGCSKEHVQEVVDIFEKYELHPAIAKIFEFEDAREAFAYSMGYTGVGKTVIKV